MIRFGLAWGSALAFTLVLGACGDDDGDGTDGVVDLGRVDSGAGDLGPTEDLGPDPEPDLGPGDDGGTEPSGLAGFEIAVATAKCAALFRCCDAASVDEFFGQYECFGGGLSCAFEDQQAALPPADMSACVAIMQELDAITLGEWVASARAGDIGFDPAVHTACLAQLDSATCGDEVQAALYDASCFGLDGLVPFGQRTLDHVMFERTAGVGDGCVSLYEDGYGSCDPAVAFCCVGDGGPCAVGGHGGEAGTCAASSAAGDECSEFPEPQLCSVSLRCAPGGSPVEPSICETVAPGVALAVGDACLSDSFESLGDCVDSYCDATSRVCTVTEPDGETCDTDEQCTSGNCAVMGTPPIVSRQCAPETFCIGT